MVVGLSRSEKQGICGDLIVWSDGQIEVETGAVARFAVNPDASLVLLNQRAANGQAEAGALLRSLQLHKAIEDTLKLILRSAGPFISNSNANGLAELSHANAHNAVRRRIFERV